MKRLQDYKFGFRLAFGFGAVALLTAVMGVVAIGFMYKLSDQTSMLYRHPFTVRAAVNDIRTNIATMHRYMVEVALAESETELVGIIDQIDHLDKLCMQEFDIIFDRFLGDKEDVYKAQRLFIEWKQLRQAAIGYKAKSNQLKTMELIREMELGHVAKLEDQIQLIFTFASNKAESFYQQAEETRKQIISLMYGLLAVIFVVVLAVAVGITRGITAPLNSLVLTIRRIATGALPESVGIKRADEIGMVADSLEEMLQAFKDAARQANRIAAGDYETQVVPRSDADELAIAMQTMTGTLKRINRENTENNWRQQGLAALDDSLRGDLETREVAERLITFMAGYLEVQVGALYLAGDDARFRLQASYAFTARKNLATVYAPGEGLVGQAALERKAILLTRVPDDYIHVVSGLGESPPTTILVVPFVLNASVKAVLELGALRSFGEREVSFAEAAADRLAILIASAESRTAMRVMLELTQKQSADLLEQQSELQAMNEELEAQTRSLLDSRGELQAQQEELQAVNEELEEKNDYLENQKREIERQNTELSDSRRHLEDRARELTLASKYKSEFLANMSHELRTPLNSLLLLARNLAQNKEQTLTTDQVQSAEIICKSGNDLLNLINEILDLAKIEAGQLRITLEPVFIQAMAAAIRTEFTPVMADKGLTLTVTVAADLPSRIISDRQRLEQIIRNLMSNAIKFTRQGAIGIAFTRTHPDADLRRSGLTPDQTIAIAVTDSGIGIAHDKQAIIFEAFQQADGSTSRQFGGTGLGLSISRELARVLGGEIQVKSAPGQGSTFTVFLPFTPDDRAAEAIAGGLLPAAPPVPVPSQHPPSREAEQINLSLPVDHFHFTDDRDAVAPGDNVVLVIEDDENFAAIVMKQCRQKCFRCIVAPNGESGLVLAGRFRPAAIILDIRLPGMSGWEVLDRLKSLAELRHIPVHVMSAEEMTLDAFKKGAVSYLTKPITQEQLQHRLDEVEALSKRDFSKLLVVEDDPVLRREILLLIGNGDAHCTEAASGAEAIAAIDAEKFDCMVLDLGLPDMTGFDLLDRLTATGSEIPPVIVYTGRDLTREEDLRIRHYTDSIIIKGVKSQDRLLDETALFLHRMVEKLPESKRRMIVSLHDQDRMFEGKKILLVDDDMRNCFALAKILKEKHLVVKIAGDGGQALEELEKEPDIDLILMDIMMPGMDGYEAMRRIREKQAFWNLPIIALTAKAMREDREKCMKSGASDYLAKPVDTEKLFSMLRVWLYR